MVYPRIAALVGYIIIAVTLCVSETTHLPQVPYVIAYAIGYVVARFGPAVLESLRGRAFGNPVLAFGVFVGITLGVHATSFILAELGVPANEVTNLDHITLAIIYAYVWEIMYDLGGPKKRRTLRSASDAVTKLVARVNAVHAPVPVRAA